MRSHCATTDKHEVASDAERRIRSRAHDGIVECIGVRHESRTGECSIAVRSDDSFVDAGRQTKIIRVQNEFFHLTGVMQQTLMIPRAH